jgi:hypothetical protein
LEPKTYEERAKHDLRAYSPTEYLSLIELL